MWIWCCQVFPDCSSVSLVTNSSYSSPCAPGDISQKGATMSSSSSSPNFCVCAASLHSQGRPPPPPPYSPSLSATLVPAPFPSLGQPSFRLSSIYFSFSFVLICRLIHCDSIAVVLVLQSPLRCCDSFSLPRSFSLSVSLSLFIIVSFDPLFYPHSFLPLRPLCKHRSLRCLRNFQDKLQSYNIFNLQQHQKRKK